MLFSSRAPATGSRLRGLAALAAAAGADPSEGGARAASVAPQGKC